MRLINTILKVIQLCTFIYLPGLLYYLSTCPTYSTISAIILPHHDIVSGYRNQLLNQLSLQIQPTTIVLLSPNHYQSGNTSIQFADQTWKTEYGPINPNLPLIAHLSQQQLGVISNGSFSNEHGIKNILGSLKHYFPQAQLVPIIFNAQTSLKQIQLLNTALLPLCQHCVVIASVDFSHNQDVPTADFNDQTTINYLSSFNFNQIVDQPLVDSPASLGLATLWAKAHNSRHFALWKQTNSSKLSKDPTIPGTSHVFGWFE